MGRNHRMGAIGAGAVALLGTGGLMINSHAAAHERASGRSVQRWAASTFEAAVDEHDGGHTAGARASSTGLSVPPAGADSELVEPPTRRTVAPRPATPDAVEVKVPRRVRVTLPRYEGGTPPSVTLPQYQAGTTPTVERDERQVVVELGEPGSLTPPSVRPGSSGTLTPPGIIVE